MKKFKNAFKGNLTIFCSDERFVPATLEFLSTNLRIKSLTTDLLVLPGGPYFIVKKEKNLVDRLRLLIEAHKIKRLFIFTHADCGYYKKKYGEASPEKISKTQFKDIAKAAKILKKMYPDLKVVCFYANVKEGKIVFQQIPTE